MAHPTRHRQIPSKHQGWSSFTLHQHQHHLHPASDFLPRLPTTKPSHFLPLNCDPEPRPLSGGEEAQLASSFSDVLKKSSLQGEDFLPQRQQAAGVSRLRAVHNWADESLIDDVLQALDLNEERASAYLLSLSSRISPSDEHNEVCAVPIVDNSQNNLPASSPFGSLPVEPEWEEDDIYYATRREALKKSRAREKHSLGAYKAFVNEDYAHAKLLSKKAHEERVEAERLHAEAARQIFLSRNSDAHKNVWAIDLHGLHVGEAIAALQQRLSEIETALSNNSSSLGSPVFNLAHDLNGDGESTSTSDPQSLKSLHPNCEPKKEKRRSFQCWPPGVVPFRQELKVVTGVGNHSRGGVSLPRAIKSFLLENRYKFEELRSGMILVHPKFHLLKDAAYPYNIIHKYLSKNRSLEGLEQDFMLSIN